MVENSAQYVFTKSYRYARVSASVATVLLAGVIALFLYLFFLRIPENYMISAIGGVVVLIPFYLFFMRKYRRRKRILQEPFPPTWETILSNQIQYYHELSPQQQSLFQKRIQIFLSEKIITGIETEISDDIRILIAASAIIPVINLPDWEYTKLREILVYPNQFDETFNFSEPNGTILGLVGIGSAMILSKPDLIRSFKNWDDGHNVGIHEFIHKVDEQDGAIDGVPSSLMTKRTEKKWRELMHREMECMKQDQSDIDPYGLTNEAEFFSVVCEYFFEKPDLFYRNHPDLYRILSQIFHQDMRAHIRSIWTTFVQPTRKRLPKNARCPCGSRKKYRDCCYQSD
jgi:MtfA peptidase